MDLSSSDCCGWDASRARQHSSPKRRSSWFTKRSRWNKKKMAAGRLDRGSEAFNSRKIVTGENGPYGKCSFGLAQDPGVHFLEAGFTFRKFVCLFRFLTSSSITRLYRVRVPRLTSDNFTCCHTRDRVGRP